MTERAPVEVTAMVLGAGPVILLDETKRYPLLRARELRVLIPFDDHHSTVEIGVNGRPITIAPILLRLAHVAGPIAVQGPRGSYRVTVHAKGPWAIALDGDTPPPPEETGK